MEAWVLITVAAAAVQTVRNAAQRAVTARAGTWGGTLVRFLYGLPFAGLAVAALFVPGVATDPIPHFTLSHLAWLGFGAVAQLLATACLLAAMRERHFVVAVTYSKTDALLVAVFALLVLAEWPGWMSGLGVVLASLGVLGLSAPGVTSGAAGGSGASGGGVRWGGRALWLGLGSGAGFALSAVGYRGAALELAASDPWVAGAWGVLGAQIIQTVLLGGWLAWRQQDALLAVARAWRVSLLAGAAGALASLGWFTAFALTSAVNVRALGMVEVLFSFVLSHRLLRERTSSRERVGLALVVAGLLLVALEA